MEILQKKSSIRKVARLVKNDVSEEKVMEALLPKLSSYQKILSFASLPHEVPLHSLNRYLAALHKLHLPKMVGHTLQVYAVSDLKHLTLHSWGLLEPNPSLCTSTSPQELDLILVPALAFDPQGYRLGHGYGYYDRLLALLPHVHTLGVGFSHQLFPTLPHEPHDIAVKELVLL